MTPSHDKPKTDDAPASLAPEPGSATRWAARGDYVETELSGGNLYRVKVETAEACAEANRLIALGRWRVSPNVESIHPDKTPQDHE